MTIAQASERPTYGNHWVMPWLVVAAAIPVLLNLAVTAVIYQSMLGADFNLYIGATERWLAGGPFYLPEQVVGPYDMPWGQILYPPQALLLFVPFTVLPPVLFVLVPVTITITMMWSWRPAIWSWFAILATLWIIPLIVLNYVAGNPTIWVVAVIALATRWPWLSALIWFKPSVFPFALLGVRDRRWWIASVAIICLMLVALPLSIDWLHAVLNARGANSGLLFSFYPEGLAAMLIPLLAWVARRRPRAPTIQA